MDVLSLTRGDSPLLISLPHDGTALPTDIASRLTPAAAQLPDTDWYVGRLYAFASEFGASILRPMYSRYVVDLNRPADGGALYPGRRETGLVPLRTFADEPIYRDGQLPSADECAERVERYWRPYHAALRDELGRLRALHGRALLWEGHSIRSRVPMLFEGRLPDFNLGTADGASCSPSLRARLTQVLEAQSRYNWVVDGRFKGGYITRHYGRPDAGIEAVQLELAQATYMDEAQRGYDESLVSPVQSVIRALFEVCR